MNIDAQKFTVNGSDRQWTTSKFVLWFGAGSTTKLLVHANHIEGALDECIGWIEEHAPGLFADSAVADEWQRLVDEGQDSDAAAEAAEADTTQLDCGHYLNSFEWGIVAENPTREQLAEIFGIN